MTKFAALFDIHWGYERDVQRHKSALHDPTAIAATMKFLKDFKPDVVILGGDTLDCGPISHHRKGKVGQLEGLRLLADAKECRQAIIQPLEAMSDRLIYLTGNHEDWLNDLIDDQPALDGIVDIDALLHLDQWKVIPHGEGYKLGKMFFIHGDQFKGEGGQAAKNAAMVYERNVRMGHFHTFQVYTKTSPADANGHTAYVVPCLCKKNPRYSLGSPSKWMQGFSWGYVDEHDGTFNDYVSVIVNGRFKALGKEYRG